MNDALQLLWPPFLVALCLIGIHAYFGIEVLRRKVIFVDLALAQIAALGTTVAFMLGHAMQGPAGYLYSLAFTLAAALVAAPAAGGADRRDLRGGGRSRDPADRPRAAGRGAPQADPHRQHPHGG